MKKIFTIMTFVLLCSCATYKLDKTIWYNFAPAVNDGVQGSVVTSLYFISADTIDIYSSVVVDTGLVVQPFKIASGTYRISGNPKKEAQILINAITIENDSIQYTGGFHKYDGMILISQDSVAKAYGKLPKTKLP